MPLVRLSDLDQPGPLVILLHVSCFVLSDETDTAEYKTTPAFLLELDEPSASDSDDDAPTYRQPSEARRVRIRRAHLNRFVARVADMFNLDFPAQVGSHAVFAVTHHWPDIAVELDASTTTLAITHPARIRDLLQYEEPRDIRERYNRLLGVVHMSLELNQSPDGPLVGDYARTAVDLDANLPTNHAAVPLWCERSGSLYNFIAVDWQ
jgi:hypothetical protein